MYSATFGIAHIATLIYLNYGANNLFSDKTTVLPVALDEDVCSAISVTVDIWRNQRRTALCMSEDFWKYHVGVPCKEVIEFLGSAPDIGCQFPTQSSVPIVDSTAADCIEYARILIHYTPITIFGRPTESEGVCESTLEDSKRLDIGRFVVV